LAKAERCFNEGLLLQRQAFKGGQAPVQFYVSFLFKNGPPLASNNELAPFCAYIETQLRLARVLVAEGRPYAAELVLGECASVADIVCGTEADILRYRIAKANSWAQVTLLLATDRPDESLLARQAAGATWRETLARFPKSAEFRSGVHPQATDLAWFEAQFPGELQAAAENNNESDAAQELRNTAFVEHALGVSYFNAELWEQAGGAFEKSVSLRKSGQPFDWLHLAMTACHRHDIEAAKRWYALAVADDMTHTNAELAELRREVERLLVSGAERNRRELRADY
jgi:tetratricopeptide (TPR) repeat protein